MLNIWWVANIVHNVNWRFMRRIHSFFFGLTELCKILFSNSYPICLKVSFLKFNCIVQLFLAVLISPEPSYCLWSLRYTMKQIPNKILSMEIGLAVYLWKLDTIFISHNGNIIHFSLYIYIFFKYTSDHCFIISQFIRNS